MRKVCITKNKYYVNHSSKESSRNRMFWIGRSTDGWMDDRLTDGWMDANGQGETQEN